MARLGDIQHKGMTPDEVEALSNDTFDYADRERVTIRAANLKIQNDAIDKNRRIQLAEINKIFGTNFDVTNPNAGQYNITEGYGDFTIGEKIGEVAKGVQRGAGNIVKLPGVALKAIGEMGLTRAEIAARQDIPFSASLTPPSSRGPAYFNSPVGKAERATMEMLRKAGNAYIKKVDSMTLQESPESFAERQLPFSKHPFYRTSIAVGESGPSYGTAIAATLSTGNPNIGLLVLGSTTASSSYDNLRKMGVDPDLALIGATLEGSIEMITEKVPMDMLMKGAGRPLLVRALKLGTAEAFQELLAQLGQNYVNAAIQDIDPDNLETVKKAAFQRWSVISEGWRDAMAAGFVMGGGAAGISGDPVALGRNAAEMINQYGVNPRNMNEFVYLTEQIKKNARQIDHFADIVEKAGEAGDTLTADPSVALNLAELQAEIDAKKKIAAGTPMDSAEREQFPMLAKQEDQIAELQATAPGLAGIPLAEEIIAAEGEKEVVAEAEEAGPAEQIKQIQQKIQTEIDNAETAVKDGMVVETPTRELGEGEEKVRSSSFNAMALAIEEDLVSNAEAEGTDLPTYKTKNHKEAAERATEIIMQDIEKAKRIGFYQEPAPPDIYPEDMFSALKTAAAMTGDADLIMDIATNAPAARVHTVMGKRIQALDTQSETDPTEAVQDVMAARVEKKIRDGEDITNLEVDNARLKIELDTAKKALDDHIEKTKQQYGSKNKAVTRVEYDKIIERRREEAANMRHDPRMGAIYIPNAQDFIDIGKIGMFHLEAIGRNFTKWSYQMQQDFGDWISPYLADEFDKVTTVADDIEIDNALDKLKKRLQKQIAGLEKQIETGQIVTKTKKPTLSDAEVVALRKKLEQTKIEFADVFEEELTDRKVAAAIKTTQKSIAALTRKIKAGETATKTRAKLSSPELDKLRSEQAALRTELQGMRDVPKKVPKTRLEKKKARLKTETAKKQKQFDERDFEKKPFVPIELDAEGQRLQDAYDALKREYKSVQAAHKIITEEEIRNIAQLGKDVFEREQVMKASKRSDNMKGEGSTIEEYEYGMAFALYHDYVTMLITGANKKTVKQVMKAYQEHPEKFINDAAAVSKASSASLDNSFHFRQGLPTFLKGLTGDKASAVAWTNTFIKSWKFLWDGLKGSNASHLWVTAKIVSNPDYKLLKQMKLDLFVTEEDIPIRVQEKVPFIGRFFRAADVAFELSARYLRFQLGLQYLKIWRGSGRPMSKAEMEGIGTLVNSQTMRGGSTQKSPGWVNNIFWSPKAIRGQIDMLSMHFFDPKATGFTKRRAAMNLLRYITGTAAILALANFIDDDSVTGESTSADFGKIIAGGIRYSIGGSMSVLIVLASRIIQSEFTSSTTGETREINTGQFRNMQSSDLIWSFLTNKFSPPASVLLQILNKEARFGKELTPGYIMDTLYTPLIIRSGVEAAEIADAADVLAALIAESVGFNVQAYTNPNKSTKKRKKLKMATY